MRQLAGFDRHECHDNADLPESVRINRAYVHTALKPLLPALLLGKKVAKLLRVVLRLVRHIAPNGQVRVLMTNLLDVVRFPAASFADLYHQRWRIEEAFKRLKHRLNLEHVSGLSQQAVVQDVAAKVLCDNLQASARLRSVMS